MSWIGRRDFIKRIGLGMGLWGAGAPPGSPAASLRNVLNKAREEVSPRRALTPRHLCNVNVRTAVGLGDEHASVVDGFGQIKSRHVWAHYEIGTPLKRASELESSQRLEDGYLPVVHTMLRSPKGELGSVAFSSDFQGVKADYWGLDRTQPGRVTLWFPSVLGIEPTNGLVVSQNQVLAVLPRARKIRTTQAKYNCLTLVEDLPPKAGQNHLQHLDMAFSGSRRAYSSIGKGDIEYRFPAVNGQTYYVYLGVINTGRDQPGRALLDFYVQGHKQAVDVGLGAPEQPILKEFIARPRSDSITVRVACDPSSTNPYRTAFISGIWIFNAAADPKRVVTGELNPQALFYVPCGREPMEDLASSLVLELLPSEGAEEKAWFKFPYETAQSDVGRLKEISPGAALDATRQRWNSLLEQGAAFVTGVPRLDNLYKTSLINLFLLRTRHRSQGDSDRDIYVVKPGATIYDGFWYRDGSYIVNAFGSAGYNQAAEESLRLFWKSMLGAELKMLGQEPNGAWSHPLTEWDGQGQALWALVRHYELTGDREWLNTVYPAVRRGARWIREATAQTRVVGDDGVKPVYYGLLPVGEGEAIGYGYIYYHNFWAGLGLKKALVAARALGEGADHAWMRNCYDQFTANLRRSLQQAYQRTGENSFLPGDPFNPGARIWGSLAALYPCEFLDPQDPMMTATLERMEQHSREGLYTFVGEPNKDKKMWTYITTDWAMCYLVRNELGKFHRLFNGYVDHASPTNAWIEEIWIKSRIGTGDMPHGWAAADYVLLLRQAFVWEVDNRLHLCWGISPDWLPEEGMLIVKDAPTQFGTLAFQLKRASSSLALRYNLQARAGQAKPEEIILHLPPRWEKQTKSIEINGKPRSWPPGETALPV